MRRVSPRAPDRRRLEAELVADERALMRQRRLRGVEHPHLDLLVGLGVGTNCAPARSQGGRSPANFPRSPIGGTARRRPPPRRARRWRPRCASMSSGVVAGTIRSTIVHGNATLSSIHRASAADRAAAKAMSAERSKVAVGRNVVAADQRQRRAHSPAAAARAPAPAARGACGAESRPEVRAQAPGLSKSSAPVDGVKQ